MSVAQAQRDIDGAEFAEWREFYRLWPFGEARADLRAAIAAAVICNRTGWHGKGDKPTEISDLLPDFELTKEEPGPADPEEIRRHTERRKLVDQIRAAEARKVRENGNRP